MNLASTSQCLDFYYPPKQLPRNFRDAFGILGNIILPFKVANEIVWDFVKLYYFI